MDITPVLSSSTKVHLSNTHLGKPVTHSVQTMTSETNSKTDSGLKAGLAGRNKVLTAKHCTKIGCWMSAQSEPSRCAQLSGDDVYDIDILDISEARWTDANKTTIDGVTILHSGRNDRRSCTIHIVESVVCEKIVS